MEEGDGLGKVFEFLELLLTILFGIVLVGLLEEGAGLFYFVFFLLQLCLAVDLVDLFGFQVLLMFKVCDFCEFFVDVPDLFGEGLEERFILLVYDLVSLRLALLVLLRLFGHEFKYNKFK